MPIRNLLYLFDESITFLPVIYYCDARFCLFFAFPPAYYVFPPSTAENRFTGPIGGALPEIRDFHTCTLLP